MRVAIAVDEPHGTRLAGELERDGCDVVRVAPGEVPRAEVLVLTATHDILTPELVAACDRAGVRIVPLAATADGVRLAQASGLGDALPLDVEGWRLVDVAAAPVRTPVSRRERGAVITVWGPAGAPGRSTLAVALAAELARGGRRVGLVDADSHAPSLALALGLADEGPGFAAACRHADRGGLDASELARISTPLALGDGTIGVLTGINRPSRWPELSEPRVTAALDACRDWCDYTVVDVAAPLERDEEIVSDIDGPRRNAATLGALRAADLVVAVLAADPLGAARFVRGSAELRSAVGATAVVTVANRLRPGALGIDPRGQVRRTLGRFAGIVDVAFLPLDPRSADAAMLAARPMADVAPRSPFTVGVRRFVGEVVLPALGRADRADGTAPGRERGARPGRMPRRA